MNWIIHLRTPDLFGWVGGEKGRNLLQDTNSLVGKQKSKGPALGRGLLFMS